MRVSGASSISHWRSLRVGTAALARSALPSTRALWAGNGRLARSAGSFRPGATSMSSSACGFCQRAFDHLALQIDRAVLVEAAPAVVRPSRRRPARAERAGDDEVTAFHGSPSRSDHHRYAIQRPHDQHGQPDQRWTSNICARASHRACRSERRAWNHAALHPATNSSSILRVKAAVGEQFGRLGREHQQARGCGQRETDAARRRLRRASSRTGTGRAAAEHPQFEQHQIAQQQRDADDVDHLQRRIGPGGRFEGANEPEAKSTSGRRANSSSISAMRALTATAPPASRSASSGWRTITPPLRAARGPHDLHAARPAPAASAASSAWCRVPLPVAATTRPCDALRDQRIDDGAARACVAHHDLHARPACARVIAARRAPAGPGRPAGQLRNGAPRPPRRSQRAGIAGAEGIEPVGVDLGTSKAPWTVPAQTTTTPLRTRLPAATAIASATFCGPSGASAVAGRIAQVSTTGLVGASTACRKNAVSSSVSVPCVIDDARARRPAPASGRTAAPARARSRSPCPCCRPAPPARQRARARQARRCRPAARRRPTCAAV